MGGTGQHGFDACGVGSCLVPECREACNALAQCGFGWVERTGFDGIVEPLEAHVGLGGTLVQLRNMLAASLDTLLSAVQQRCQHVLDPFGIK
ncbi:MAG: hypothetical protein KDG54_06320 [Geminicoccaceae bacterium]|nr:hypothetical protein [Geminicoccaceae bacterium]